MDLHEAQGSAVSQNYEAFAQAFLERLAGSQGRALRRVPQDTESPLDFRLAKINKNKKEKRIPQDAQSLERPSERTVFPFCLFELIPGTDTGNQKGISHPAGCDSGLCPENPQPLKRLAKLSAGLRCPGIISCRKIENLPFSAQMPLNAVLKVQHLRTISLYIPSFSGNLVDRANQINKGGYFPP